MSITLQEFDISAGSIFESLRESILILDKELRVVSANRAFFRQFSVTPAETENRLIYELGNGQWNIPGLRELLERIIPERESFQDFEVHHQFETIGEKVMVLNARRLVREKEKTELILLAIEDISKRYHTRKRLEESEERYRRLVENINSIIIGVDREGNLTFFNAFSEELFGYARDQILGKPLVGTILPPVEADGTDNSHLLNDVFRHPEKFYASESEGMRRDGSRVVFSWSVLVQCDESGNVTEALIDGNDVSELAAVRRHHREESAVLKAMMEFFPEGIMVTDENHVVKRVSKRLGDILGMPADALMDTNEPERLKRVNLRWPDGKRLKDPGELPLSRAAKTGKQYFDYEMILDRNGEERIISTNAAPIRNDEGRVVGAIGGWHDITRRKRAEQALWQRTNDLALANQELESFSYSVSHDLRGPLNVIGSLVDVLREEYSEGIEKELNEYLMRIDGAVHKMSRIIDDMLALARVSKHEVSPVDVDLSAKVQQYLKELQEAEPDRRVELLIKPNIHVHADPRLIALALENLLRNAWKFSSKKDCACIEFGDSEQNGERVYYVKDNGAGFPSDKANELFKPFRRLHSESQFGGTGVGLPIVQRAINRHGGRVWAEGDEGKGAGFFFTLGG